jgi:diguanylate cyclase (GGDEF)-like protein
MRSPPIFALLAALVICCAASFGYAGTQLDAEVEFSDTHTSLTPMTAVLVDASRQLTFEQIQQENAQQRFSPLADHGRTSNFGLTRSAIWLRVQLPLPNTAPTLWMLEVASPMLDRIDLFYTDRTKGPEHLRSGDQMPFSQRPLPHRNHVFPLHLTPGASQTLYLRVVSDGNLSVPLQLWRPAALAQTDHASYGALSLYFGLLLGLVMYNLLLYTSLRDNIYLSYVGFATGMIFGQLGLTGFGEEFFWPNAPWWGNIAAQFSMAVAGVFAALFARQFLGTAVRAVLWDKVLVALAVLMGTTALCVLVLPYHLCAWLINIDAIIFACTLVGVSLHCLLHKHIGARHFGFAWATLLLGVLVTALHNLGLLPSHPIVTHAMLIGSAVEMLALSFSLADRIHVSRREAVEAHERAYHSELAVLNSLRDSERKLEGRVQERTRELEKANRELRLNEEQLALQAHHDPLTGLANRKLLGDRLNVAMAHAKRNQQGFAVLMLDLDGFKPVNDRYGHAAGDSVLQSVALRLTSTVRGVDTVARVGGDEFVLILDAVSDGNTMMSIARKVRDVLSTPITLDTGEIVQIGTSIGLAIYPVDGTNVEELLTAADNAMYATKNSRYATLQ